MSPALLQRCSECRRRMARCGWHLVPSKGTEAILRAAPLQSSLTATKGVCFFGFIVVLRCCSRALKQFVSWANSFLELLSELWLNAVCFKTEALICSLVGAGLIFVLLGSCLSAVSRVSCWDWYNLEYNEQCMFFPWSNVVKGKGSV